MIFQPESTKTTQRASGYSILLVILTTLLVCSCSGAGCGCGVSVTETGKLERNFFKSWLEEISLRMIKKTVQETGNKGRGK